jgi:MOSC domain-containing protein YiiM
MEPFAGKLIAIAVRAKSRAPMVEVDQATITSERGVAGDFRGTPGSRQVTLLSAADWNAACEVLGEQLPWTVRRANLLVEGLALCDTTDAIIRIGEVVLQVSGETKPCSRMDEAAPGLRRALTPRWRGGVCCRIISGGKVAPGAAVTLESPGL